MSLSVQSASPSDAVAVHELLAAAGRALAIDGFQNWSEPYPLLQIERAIEDGALFVAHEDGRLVAAYALRRVPPHPYMPAPWPDPELPALYLNRMAVEPGLQGRGVGSHLLLQIEAQAARS